MMNSRYKGKEIHFLLDAKIKIKGGNSEINWRENRLIKSSLKNC